MFGILLKKIAKPIIRAGLKELESELVDAVEKETRKRKKNRRAKKDNISVDRREP